MISDSLYNKGKFVPIIIGEVVGTEQDRSNFSNDDFGASSTGRIVDELERMLRWLNVADEETPIYAQVVYGLDFNPLETYRTDLA